MVNNDGAINGRGSPKLTDYLTDNIWFKLNHSTAFHPVPVSTSGNQDFRKLP